MFTKMDKVMKSNVEVITEQIDKAIIELHHIMAKEVLATKSDYTKELFLVEDRIRMLTEANSSLKAFLDTAEMTPQEHEDIIKEMGKDPKKLSMYAKQQIIEYHLIDKPELEPLFSLLGALETISILK